MDLPAAVTGLGEQLRGTFEITPDPALFAAPEVFAAERERIFSRPLMAVDHATRLSKDGHFFRVDAAPRSVLVTRDSEGCLHALRNVCIHAGYPVCDAEEGAAERLICPYHGWEFALDGRLLEPELSSRIDPARLRMRSYPVAILNGLILVDPSGNGDRVEHRFEPALAWLAEARVTRRARYATTWNWKFLRHFLQSSPHLFLADAPDEWFEFGPLSLMIVSSQQAVLLRIIPKFAEQTDFEVIEMAVDDAPERGIPDAVAEGLRCADTSVAWFDRRFADWYWSLVSEG